MIGKTIDHSKELTSEHSTGPSKCPHQTQVPSVRTFAYSLKIEPIHVWIIRSEDSIRDQLESIGLPSEGVLEHIRGRKRTRSLSPMDEDSAEGY